MKLDDAARPQVSARGLHIALIASRFNASIVEKLLVACRDTLAGLGADPSQLIEVWVPGAFELATAAQRAAESGRFDGIVCLGAVVRGDTPHFDYVASAAAQGIAEVGRSTGVPTIFGVLTTDTPEQAADRAGGSQGNKGEDCAYAVTEMVAVMRNLGAGAG